MMMMMMMIVRMMTKTSTDNSNTAPTNGANSQPVSDLFPLFISISFILIVIVNCRVPKIIIII